MSKKEKHIVYVPKVGTYVDSSIGGHFITKPEQNRIIQDAKKHWKETINSPKCLCSELSQADENTPYPHLKYSVIDNPYFGWEENQLKIVKR